MLRRMTRILPASLLRTAWFLLLAAPSWAAGIWPDQLGAYSKVDSRPAAVQEPSVWQEYGLQETEQAEYVSGKSRFTASAYRFRDPTGALAAFQWQRPARASRSELGKIAVRTPDSTLFAYHNYLFRFDGRHPEAAELEPLLLRLPRLDQSSLPPLPDYLPAEGLIPNSERYVVGPASLALFEPRITPAMAAFHLGTEAQLARYRSKNGELELAILSFPTPNLARERAEALSQLAGALVKRTGPLVAVVLPPADAGAAETLLAKINYQASISWSEYVPTLRDNPGNLLWGIAMLVGVLLAFCISVGTVMGLGRMLARRYLKRWIPEDPMILLHLGDRQVK
jgi:hypothetical protein